MSIDEALGHAWFNDIIAQTTIPLPPSISTTTSQQFAVPVYPINSPGLPAADVDMVTFPKVPRQSVNMPRVRSQRPMLQPYAKVYEPVAATPRRAKKRKAAQLDEDSPMHGCDEPGPSGANANANDSDARRVKAKISEPSQSN